jgi:putative ABC transport system permease protein
MIKDYFTIPFKEIRRKGVRSWLTLIGIFIGISAIVSLILLGQGLENAITDQFQSLGEDKIFLSAKTGNIATMGMTGNAIKITEKDKEIIENLPEIHLVVKMSYTMSRIEYNEFIKYLTVMGMEVGGEKGAMFGEAQGLKIVEGRELDEGDKYHVVLGHEYTLDNLFEKKVRLGDKIKIANHDFKVVGFLKKIGSPQDDQSAMIPIETYEEIYNIEDEIGMLVIQVEKGENMDSVVRKIKSELNKYRNVEEDKEDYILQTPEELLEIFSEILDMIKIILVGIASISLFVGGVGIMNTMYTNVLERTKEIGIMKALGAKNNQIMYLFLVESGLYGLGGGIVGVIVGVGLAKLTEYAFSLVLSDMFLSIRIDWMLIIGALIFSLVVGCISGIAPARQAAKQNPVDSLRYE